MEGHDLHKAFAAVVLRQNGVHILQRHLLCEQPAGKRNHHRHALVEIAHDRIERGREIESAVFLHLGQVLVAHTQRVMARGSERKARASRRFVYRDHFLATAAVAGERMAGHRIALRHHAGRHQRMHQQDEADRVAADIGHPCGGANLRALRLVQFRQAVLP